MFVPFRFLFVCLFVFGGMGESGRGNMAIGAMKGKYFLVFSHNPQYYNSTFLVAALLKYNSYIIKFAQNIQFNSF